MIERVVGRTTNCNCYLALTVGDLADELVLQGNVTGHHVEQSVCQLALKLIKNWGQNNPCTKFLSHHRSPYPYLMICSNTRAHKSVTSPSNTSTSYNVHIRTIYFTSTHLQREKTSPKFRSGVLDPTTSPYMNM